MGPWSDWSGTVSTTVGLPMPLWVELLLLVFGIVAFVVLIVWDKKINAKEVRAFVRPALPCRRPQRA